MTFEDLKYAQRERLIYLDKCFAWRGIANRRDLIERFGVSTAQAALDFKAYLERATKTPPIYDGGLKTYLAAKNHESLFTETLHHDWSSIIPKGNPSQFDELPKLNRLSDANIVSKIYRAIEEKRGIEVRYISMMTGNETDQWIAPTHFASDGERIHLRAFSFKHNQYRDYIPVRIDETSSFQTRKLDDELPEDTEWDTWVRIHLVPKSDLSPAQVKAVKREYGFSGKSFCVETRQALEFYADRRWGLNQPNARLERLKTEIINEY